MRDGVRAEHRARAFSIYHMSPILGKGIANWGGAILLTLAAAGTFRAWPFLAHLQPWQVAIVMPGLLGLPTALLLFTFREPRRARATTASGAAESAPPFRALFRPIYTYRTASFPTYVRTEK